jgi:hypothetical protein
VITRPDVGQASLLLSTGRILQLPFSAERRASARNFVGDEPTTRRNAVLNALSDW